MEHWAAEKVGLPSSPPYLSLVSVHLFALLEAQNAHKSKS